MDTIILWLLIAIGVIILDISTSTFLFIWFSIGAFAAIIANLLGVSFEVQMLIFALVSLVSVAIGYPIVKRKYKSMVKRTPLMEESYIGKEYLAEEDIFDIARIKVGGIYWTGINKGKKIAKGSKYKIIGIEGNKFIIESVNEEE